MRQMKDSGIPWIGYIPTTWKVRAIRYGFEVGSGSTPSSTNFEYWDGEIPWVTPADFKTEDRIVNEGRRFISKKGYASCGTRLVKEGSLIFSKRAPIGSVVLSGQKLCTNQGCFWCTPKTADVDSVFFYYTMSIYPEVFNLFGSGTTFREISADTFKNVKLSLPPYDEQKHIAAYLNHKCAEIDSLTADVQKEIETLQEYRRSLITEAVTKGLDPNVKMKASNSQSIGLIPSTWSCMRIKNVLSGITDGTHGTYTRTEEGHPLLSAKNVFDDGLHLGENESLISEKDYQSIVGNGFPQKGDVLLCCVGTVGRCTEYVDVHPYAFQRSVIIMRPNSKIISPMLTYVMQSNTTLSQETAMINQAAQAGLYQGAVKELHIPVPPLEEQNRIVRFLDNKLDEIDYIIETKQKQLETLAEYRKSLIYEYVTGKKEVV